MRRSRQVREREREREKQRERERSVLVQSEREREIDFHLLKDIFNLPLLVSKGTYHYWTCDVFFQGSQTNGSRGSVLVPGCRI